LVGPLVGLGIEETLPLVAHQGVEELPVIAFHLFIEIFDVPQKSVLP
jgi:hypothetical protein